MNGVPFPETGSHRERKLWGKSRDNIGHVMFGKPIDSVVGRITAPRPCPNLQNRDYVVLHARRN